MKKLILMGAAAAVLCTTSASAQTAPPYYAELNYSWAKIEDSGVSATPKVAGARFGANLTNHFALELFLGANGGSDNIEGVDVKLKNAVGMYVKGSAPLGPQAQLFARVGYMRAKLELSGVGGSESASDNSFSYGAGLQFNLTPQVYGTVDYTSFYDRNGMTVRGPSVGLGLKF